MPHKPIASSPLSFFFRSYPEMMRLQKLDSLLSDGQLHSMESLVLDCSNSLKNGDDDKVQLFSKNTILNDLNTLQTVWKAKIEIVKAGRTIGYRYAQQDFSVFSVDYNSERFTELQRLMQFLAPLRTLNGFEWSADLIAGMEKAFGLQSLSDQYISFETQPDLLGTELLMPVYSAIAKKQLLTLIYKSFWWPESRELVVSPYYLKQYNQNWYLLARNEQTGKCALYGLDRIMDAKVSEGTYSVSDVNPIKYFADVVGVTNLDGKPVEEIVLNVNKSYFNYIDNKPIHPSQEYVSEDEESVTIKLSVKVNRELEKLLLANVLNITIVEPVSLRMRMSNILNEALLKYK